VDDLNYDRSCVCGAKVHTLPKRLHRYSYKPYRWRPIGRPPAPHLGVELELDYDAAPKVPHSQVAGAFEPRWFWIAKVDGSVRGPELVSQPATLSYWRQHASEVATSLHYAAHQGYASHDGGRAGLHVGIETRNSRGEELLTAGQRLLIVGLIHGNPEQSLRLARRSQSAADRWAELFPRAELGSAASPGTRYCALNPHSSYVEFRLPRGTLKLESFYATLEWAASLFRWARICPIEVSATDIAADVGPDLWDNWKSHVRFGDYPMLREYMMERGV
jgi:hypothetical protein